MLIPSGIHHVTAIASAPQRNLDFYGGVLGLRLVKRTVNYDDPTTYHFYFGDAFGTPGSLLTFFPWPNARRGRQGAGQVAVISLAIIPHAVGFWLDQLLKHHVEFDPPVTRFDDEKVIAFRDPDGMMLELVAHPSAERRPPWTGHPISKSETIPAEYSIRGIYSVTLWEEGLTRTAELLTGQLGFKPVREQGSIYRYSTGADDLGSILDLRVVPGLWKGVLGAGIIHHIAFRAESPDNQIAVREHLDGQGYNITPQLDRHYFRSVYFREPGDVLFELATDVPGFTVDEPLDRLGRSLQLPPWLESRRFEIEALLPNIHLPIDLDLHGPNA